LGNTYKWSDRTWCGGITDRTCCSRQLIQFFIFFAKLEGANKSTSSKKKKKRKKAYNIGKRENETLQNNGNIKDARGRK
jgi:hypothetical protein